LSVCNRVGAHASISFFALVRKKLQRRITIGGAVGKRELPFICSHDDHCLVATLSCRQTFSAVSAATTPDHCIERPDEFCFVLNKRNNQLISVPDVSE
jgi:hypothetical protein